LIKKLSPIYPYKTRTVGTEHGIYQDGGVVILSRWFIENGQGEQRLFKDICSSNEEDDCKADKGVIYARINKKGHKYHVFGTHTDAGKSSQDVSTRKKQFEIIRKFIEEKIRSTEIKPDELVMIAGDLNVDKYYANSVEYNEMLRELNAIQPPLTGYPFSSDQNVNDLLPHAGKRELLDYILISKSTQVPLRGSYNQVLFFRADQGWRNYKLDKAKYKYFWDLSDHYPVFGQFVLLPAISKTPAEIMKSPVKPPGQAPMK
jgi:hypothetical protein